MEASVRDLKNRLSAHLRRVQTGEEVLITSRGKPVARLIPVRTGDKARSRPSTLERLRALSWVTAGRAGKLRGSKRPLVWKRGRKLASDIVREGRE